MINISNLTLGQLEELQDRVHIRIEHLKKEIPEVNIGDCFVYVSTGSTYICFCKVKNIENDSYEIEFIAYDTTLSADYCIDKGVELMTRVDFADYTPITLEVYEKAIQLKSDFKNQLDKVVEQLNLSIKTLIND